jgi:putative addiction module CopG family antidote
MATDAQSANDLPLRIEHLVQEQIATGRFRTTDEVLVEALETLRDVEQMVEPVRDELRERLSRAGKGDSLPLDRAAFFAEARRRLAAE